MVALSHIPAMVVVAIPASVEASQEARPNQDAIVLSVLMKTPAARFTQTIAPQVYHLLLKVRMMNQPPYNAVQPTTTDSAVYEVPIYVVQPTITVFAVSLLPDHPSIRQAPVHPVLLPHDSATLDPALMIQCILQTLSLQLIHRRHVG